MNDPKSLAQNRTIIRWLMLVILAWGLMLALGTYLFGGNKPLLRALTVAGCTLAFLALWLTALAFQRRSSDP